MNPNVPQLLQQGPDLAVWVAGSVGLLFVLAFFLLFLSSCLLICRPNEVLVIAGRSRKVDGKTVGSRVIFSGRAIRIPIFERVYRMDTTLMPIAIESRNAYSKGGIPLTVQAIAMVKLSTNTSYVGNAIERFLDKPRQYLQQVSRETLEGHLRGVLATLTPEEVNADRLKFAARLGEEAEVDLQKLGLHLDTLKVQHIADDVNYLNSLGREQIANVLRDAEIAESNAKATADQAAAQGDADGKIASEKAQQAILRKENELRTLRAELGARAQAEVERAEAAADEAFAVAEQQLQAIRANLEKIRLESDLEIPAEARRVAMEQLAAGEAARIAEEGRARAEVLAWLAAVWRKAGPRASEIFLMRQLDDVLAPVVGAVKSVEVHDSAVVDAGDGRAFASLVSSRPTAVLEVLRRIGEMTGLDLGSFSRAPSRASGPPPGGVRQAGREHPR